MARPKKLRGFPHRIMGVENEYGLLVTSTSGKNRKDVVSGVCQFGRNWLDNGCCFYPDIENIETCTAEVRSGAEAVTYDRVLEQIIIGRLQQLPFAAEVEAHLLKNNIGRDHGPDNQRPETTYGCHENYLIGTDTSMALLVSALALFLVTRQLFAGAGSVVEDRSGRWHFELSQRARHIHQLRHSQATSQRGFIKETSESLGLPGAHQRFQVVMGDANILWEPAVYKLDLTSLMILLYENGALPSLAVLRPAGALQRVAREGPRTPLEVMDGSWMSALDIQWCYLEAAEDFVTRWGLVHFAPAVRYWREVLDAFTANNEAALWGRVDWVTKRQLLQRAQQHQGKLSWQQAFRRDLAYHDLTSAGANLPQLLRARTDPPELAAAVERAWHTPPPGRPTIRVELAELARQYGVYDGQDWNRVSLGKKGILARQAFLLPDPYSEDRLVLTRALEYATQSMAA